MDKHVKDAFKAVGWNLFRLVSIRKTLKLFDTNKKYDIDLPLYLKKYLKDGYNPEHDFSIYDLVYNFGLGRRGFGIYNDAKYNFVLRQSGSPVASIGFDIEKRAVKVKQIQGMLGKAKELKPFRWEKMLLKVVTDFSSTNKFRQVMVQRAQDSEWFKDYDKKRCERLKMKYDVTAKRCGFRYNEKLKCYCLDL